MGELPTPLQRFLWAVYAAAAAALILVGLTLDRFPIPPLFPLVVLASLAALSDLLPISYPDGLQTTPMTAFLLAVIVLLPPLGVVLVVLAGTLPSEMLARKPWYKVAFNVSMRLIAYLLLTFGSPSLQLAVLRLSPIVVLVASITAIAVYMFFLSLMNSIVRALQAGTSLAGMWRNIFMVSFNDYSLIPYGLILAWLWQIHPAYFTLGLIPLVAIYRAFSMQASLLVEKGATARLLAQQQEVQAATVALLTRDELRDKLDAVLHHLITVLPTTGAYVALWGQDGKEDVVVTWGAPVGEVIDVGSTNIRQLCQARQIAQIPVQGAIEVESVVVVPLVAEEDIVGGMFLLTDGMGLAPEMRTLLETFAAQAALALAQARLIDELKSSQRRLVQSERLNAIGRLAAGVAHEFNNLLAGILGTAELALLLDNHKEQVDALQTVVRVTQQGGSISRGLLAFSRQLEPRRELANLEDAINPILILYQREFARTKVRVERKIELTPSTVCDIGLLSQVVVNLVLNALDAMQDKGGVLTVGLQEEAGSLHLWVGDTGSGIPPSMRDQMFEPFATTKGQGSEKLHGGSGLGLAIVYGIVTDHGGRITVDSTVGYGTTMNIWIPIVAGEIVTRPVLGGGPPVGLRAVVIDDEPLIARAVHGMLTSEGHPAQWFTEPQAALQWMRKHPTDVLFVDLTMPEVDGIQLIEAALQIHPHLHTVIITGQIDEKQFMRAQGLGVTTVLEKPFSIKEIRGALRAFKEQAVA